MDEIKTKVQQFTARALKAWKDEDVTALTPVRVDNYSCLLSGLSAMLEEEYGRLCLQELDFKEALDQEMAENRMDRLWRSSKMGRKQIKLKYTLKAVDKIISACKMRLRRLNNEAYNVT